MSKRQNKKNRKSKDQLLIGTKNLIDFPFGDSLRDVKGGTKQQRESLDNLMGTMEDLGVSGASDLMAMTKTLYIWMIECINPEGLQSGFMRKVICIGETEEVVHGFITKLISQGVLDGNVEWGMSKFGIVTSDKAELLWENLHNNKTVAVVAGEIKGEEKTEKETGQEEE